MLVGSLPSCKTGDEFDPVYSDTITGKWMWIQTREGGAPGPMNPLTPKNTGITESIIFTTDSTWSKVKNKKIIEFGERFTIGHGVYIIGGSSFYDPNENIEFRYEYDSILYIKNGIPVGTDCFIIEENNLNFSNSLKGVLGGGSKHFKRSK